MSGQSEPYSTSGDSGFGDTKDNHDVNDAKEYHDVNDAAKVKCKTMLTTKIMNPPEPKEKGVLGGTTSTRVALDAVKGEQWYHGQMEREVAEEILKSKPAGTFIVRYSYKPPVVTKLGYLKNRDNVVLSNVLSDGGTVQHTYIRARDASPDNTWQTFRFYLTKEQRVKNFDSVTELLLYYTNHTLHEVDNNVFKKADFLKYYISAGESRQLVEMGREIIQKLLVSPTRLEQRCTVDTSGGVFQRDNSDVQLQVPPGAVPAGKTYDIENWIHVTNLEDFRSHVTTWTAHEHFVSPAAEFMVVEVDGKKTEEKAIFNKHVTIRIPHCVDESCLGDLNVYCSDPELKKYGTRVPRHQQGSSTPDCYYTVNSQYVCVHTTHFTQFFCSCTRDCRLQMATMLFAGTSQFSSLQAVDISVYIGSSLFKMTDFEQVIIQQESRLSPPRRLITGSALNLPPEVRHDEEFHVEIEPYHEEWSHICPRGMTPAKILRVRDVLECYHICQEGTEVPRPKDVKFHLQNQGQQTESFTGHLSVNVARRNGVPGYDLANLNQLTFTLAMRNGGNQSSDGASV